MPSLSPRGTWQIFLPIAAAVIFLAWGIAADHVADVRQQTYLNAEHHVRTLAETHAQQTTLTLTIAQEALIHLRATLQKEGFAQFEREAERLSGKGSGGPLNRVSLVAADGRMLANHLDGRRGSLANISDRAYFQEIRQWDEDRVHVTEPFRGRFTGEWIVLFSQAVRQNGRFDGLVQVGLPAERLGLMFHTVGGAGEVVSLLSPGGHIIARSNGTEHIGHTADLPTGTDGTTLSHTSPVDGVRRLVSVSTIPGFDLRVVAGTDLQVLDAEIGEHTRVAYLPALLLTVLLVPAALLILYAGRSQQATHLALQAETRRSRTVFETMGEGILLLDADATVSFANTRAGIWLPQAAGRRLTEALQDADFTLVSESGQAVAGGNPVIERCLAAGEDIDGIWLKRGSGSNEIWLALRARAFGDTDGAVLGATITLADRSESSKACRMR
jgi:PAS domain-containing protein